MAKEQKEADDVLLNNFGGEHITAFLRQKIMLQVGDEVGETHMPASGILVDADSSFLYLAEDTSMIPTQAISKKDIFRLVLTSVLEDTIERPDPSQFN